MTVNTEAANRKGCITVYYIFTWLFIVSIILVPGIRAEPSVFTAGHAYLGVKGGYTWDEAKKTAARLGGYPAAVDDTKEAAIIAEIAEKHGVGDIIWISGDDPSSTAGPWEIKGMKRYPMPEPDNAKQFGLIIEFDIFPARFDRKTVKKDSGIHQSIDIPMTLTAAADYAKIAGAGFVTPSGGKSPQLVYKKEKADQYKGKAVITVKGNVPCNTDNISDCEGAARKKAARSISGKLIGQLKTLPGFLTYPQAVSGKPSVKLTRLDVLDKKQEPDNSFTIRLKAIIAVELSGETLVEKKITSRISEPAVEKGDYNVIASCNYPKYFLSYSGIGQPVRIVKNADTSATARWKIVPGLVDAQGISFESVEHPGHYLRHYDSRISLALNDGSPTFDSDATFVSRTGWADKGMVSFELYNFPGKYIRHHMLILRIDSVNSDSPTLLKKDATFNLISAKVEGNQTKLGSLAKTPAKKNAPVAQSKPETKKRVQMLVDKGVIAKPKMIKRNQTLIDKGVIAKAHKPPEKDPISHGTMTMNTDRYGKDYKLIKLSKPNPDICRTACAEDKKCESWTYVKPGVQGPGARCYLKQPIAQASLNNCCVSGVKQKMAIQKDAVARGRLDSSLFYNDIYVGKGKEVKKNDRVLMCYSFPSKNKQINFTTYSNISFEKSTCTPVAYRVGSAQMVKGIEMAIQGEQQGDDQMRMPPMRIGGRREIVAPPELAWGKKGIPGRIPPDMSFYFIIEIIDILN